MDIPRIPKHVAKRLDGPDEVGPVVDVHRRKRPFAQVLRRDEIIAVVKWQLVQQDVRRTPLAQAQQLRRMGIFEVLNGAGRDPYILPSGDKCLVQIGRES
ncbi:hypothetical protein WKW77_23430 [Variovorax ureilyticus]|uniref:Uncharacterized protein n=1 Tax=Variovorax ureilyticus TaxID=1836198 RepID=A0ABU8VKA9_9BURK